VTVSGKCNCNRRERKTLDFHDCRAQENGCCYADERDPHCHDLHNVLRRRSVHCRLSGAKSSSVVEGSIESSVDFCSVKQPERSVLN
jgi:hypothetical protein